MQEVLYVANQLDDTLKLGLDLAASNENETPKAEEFVADYSKLAKNLPDEARTIMNDAMGDLVDYFHKNSYYSSKSQE